MDVSFSGILTFIEKLAATQPTLAQPAHSQAATIVSVVDSTNTFSSTAVTTEDKESEPAIKKQAFEAHIPTATSTGVPPTTATASANNISNSSSGSIDSSCSSSGISAAESFKADLCYSLQETLFAMLVLRILHAHIIYACRQTEYYTILTSYM